jgi:hypothetical protein
MGFNGRLFYDSHEHSNSIRKENFIVRYRIVNGNTATGIQ